MRGHCASRQIDGCSNGKVEQINCSNGYADASGKLYDLKGNIVWEYPLPAENDNQSEWKVTNPFVQEHINLVTAIRTGNTINDGVDQAYSTLVTIMGRIAAYTGKDITWDEILNSELYLGPKTYLMGKVENIPRDNSFGRCTSQRIAYFKYFKGDCFLKAGQSPFFMCIWAPAFFSGL